jgi:Predicted metal-dependent phosphoesterases (PHP family)
MGNAGNGERFVDLHTHTCASDGTDTPEALVAKAAKASLTAIAVTDHDTLAGLDEACAAGARHGITVVRGSEIAAASPHGEIHILGLWLPEHAPRLEAALAHIRKGRDERNREMAEGLRKAGYPVTYEEFLALVKGESGARPHMARLLVAKGICSSPEEAFSRFLGEGKPMFVPRSLPAPEEVVSLLASEGAVTVFAHPMLVKAPLDWLYALVGTLVDAGLHALEAYHAEHDAKAVRRAVSLARHYKLALSGGSDYHGEARPHSPLGFGSGGNRVPYALLERLHACRQ